MTANINLTRWLANTLLAVQLCKIRVVQGRRIAALARNPMRAQRALLAKILATNRNTTFGRRHGFSGIRSYEAFAATVPVSTFEQLRPYVDAEIGCGEAALTSEAPLCYVRTSGTTGRPKDLPLTATHLKALRRIQEIAIAFQHRSCPEAFAGSMLAIASPPQEGVLENGKVFGSASGIVARNTPRVVRDKFIIPPVVLTIKDSRLKYLLILRLAVARADLSYIATANATTLLTLIRLYRLHHAELIDDVDRGGFFLGAKLPSEVAVAVTPQLRGNPQRAAELRRLRARHGEVRLADLWPKLGLVGTWTFASAGISVDALRQELRHAFL